MMQCSFDKSMKLQQDKVSLYLYLYQTILHPNDKSIIIRYSNLLLLTSMLTKPSTLPASPHSTTINFDYFSPTRLDRIIISPKHSYLQNHQKTQPAPLSSLTSLITNCSAIFQPPKTRKKLDTTLESHVQQIQNEKLDNKAKKAMCQSVIIKSSNNSQQNINDISLSDLSRQEQVFSGQNYINRSFVKSNIFHDKIAKKTHSYTPTEKQNCSFIAQSKCEQIKQPFCFNRDKVKLKKREGKLSKAKIQDFSIGQLLGKGSIGRVYLAMHKQTGSYFALKKVLKQQVKDIKQFCLGVKAHIFSHHPHICQLYACFHDTQHIYLLMELCTDGNLSRYKKKIKNDEERDKILQGITKGVQYMHQHHLRHGDLKLQNILVSYAFPKITDLDCISFSYSNQFKQIRRKSLLWGSPAYFSPDMIKQCSFALSDDIWSLGVISYELYCNSHPFNLKGSQDLAKIAHNEMTPMPASIKQPTRSIVKWMLAKSSKKRASLSEILEYCESSCG